MSSPELAPQARDYTEIDGAAGGVDVDTPAGAGLHPNNEQRTMSNARCPAGAGLHHR